MTDETKQGAVPARSEVPLKYRWNLEAIFPSDAAWEDAFRQAEARLPELEQFRGQLASSAGTLLRGLQLRDEIGEQVERVADYAMLRRTEDATNAHYAALADRGEGLATRFATACSYFPSEILELTPEQIEQDIAAEPGLAAYRREIEVIQRQRGHIRSAEVEEVLALAGDLATMPAVINSMLEDADLKLGTITNAEGQQVELAQGNLDRYLQSTDRNVRRQAWESSADAYLSMQHTFAATLAAGVKRDVLYARAHRYGSALEAALAPDNIPTAVFHNLLDTVWQNFPVWHRYFNVRRRLLGLDELHGYDLTASLVTNEPKVTFAEGVDLILAGLAPFGDDYVGIIRQGITDRWVDAMPNIGKGGGAFSDGAYGTMPYISMSWSDDIGSVSTLVHELGHSLHSYQTWQAQPITYAQYSMFAAETASNLHQAILGGYLLDLHHERDWTITVIEERMANHMRYLFTMPILARFEHECHQRIERGEALTADGMNELLLGYYKEGYGGEVVIDPARMGITWARFSHLYMNYYVFQYATGISAAAAIAAMIREEGTSVAQRYIGTFLRAGSTVDPIEALQAVGVDMRSPAPVQRAFDILSSYVDKLEAYADAAG